MCLEIHLECEFCGRKIREWITKCENSQGCQIPRNNGEFFQLLTVITRRDQKCHICEFLPGIDKNNIQRKLKVKWALNLVCSVGFKWRRECDATSNNQRYVSGI